MSNIMTTEEALEHLIKVGVLVRDENDKEVTK